MAYQGLRRQYLRESGAQEIRGNGRYLFPILSNSVTTYSDCSICVSNRSSEMSPYLSTQEYKPSELPSVYLVILLL